MTHLYIELNGITEEVNSLIIKKLYNLASSGDLDETSDLKGRLHSYRGYALEVQYLTTNFLNLFINCDELYVQFLDPLVESILATNFGDGTGITLSTVNSLSSFGGKFANSNIVSFNELSQFPNIIELNNNNTFRNCSSLTSIDLSNITKVSGKNGYQRYGFENCTSLTSIGNTSNLTYVGFLAFYNTRITGVIDFSNVTYFGSDCLYGTDLSQCSIDQSKIEYIGSRAFRNHSEISSFTILNLPNLKSTIDGETSCLDLAFDLCTQIQHVTNLGLITEIGCNFNEGVFRDCTNLLDVTLPETVTLIRYSLFSGNNSLRWVKVLSTTLPDYRAVTGHGVTSDFGVAFGESFRNNDKTGTYNGKTYPIYVRDDLYSQYQVATNWDILYQVNRLKPLSLFSTDFPNE